MSEWVKCSDRLPPKGTYLCIMGEIKPGTMGVLEFDGKSTWDDHDYGPFYVRENFVTHWMLLPPHPEE